MPPRLLIESDDAVAKEASFALIGNGRLYGGLCPSLSTRNRRRVIRCHPFQTARLPGNHQVFAERSFHLGHHATRGGILSNSAFAH